MEKNFFRKTCITYRVLEYIETMNVYFTLSWQSIVTLHDTRTNEKILPKMFWQS